jgi:hypothetical protein
MRLFHQEMVGVVYKGSCLMSTCINAISAPDTDVMIYLEFSSIIFMVFYDIIRKRSDLWKRQTFLKI